jgi:hypothetical protein
MEMTLVDNEKAFVAYTLILTAAVGGLVTALMALGIAPIPHPETFASHVMLSLAMRASYKAFGGWDVTEWDLSLNGGRKPARELPVLVAPRGAAGAGA